MYFRHLPISKEENLPEIASVCNVRYPGPYTRAYLKKSAAVVKKTKEFWNFFSCWIFLLLLFCQDFLWRFGSLGLDGGFLLNLIFG